MCPHCRQNAPIVYRGVAAYCSACQRQRPALIAPSVSYAGKPSAVGGTVAGIIGWIVLVVGLSATIGLGLLLSIVSTTFGLAVGIPMGILTIAVSLSLLLSGRSLRKTGEKKQKEMRVRAITGLAMNRGGALTAADVAASLDMPVAEADAFLTDMAKTMSDDVTVELDDKGGIYYAFPRVAGPRQRPRIEDPRVRVDGVPDTFEAEGLDYEEPARKQQRRGP
jgi:hypothetical protein